MKMVTVKCQNCDLPVDKEVSEYNRSMRLGRRFFCNLSCTAYYSNTMKNHSRIMSVCEYCDKRFESVKGTRYCSNSCSVKDNQTEERILARKRGGNNPIGKANLISLPAVMKLREAWKYVQLQAHFNSLGIEVEFEYGLDEFVYDLLILDQNHLIEFDSPYHNESSQREIDSMKDELAINSGFLITRISVDQNSVIPVECIAHLI